MIATRQGSHPAETSPELRLRTRNRYFNIEPEHSMFKIIAIVVVVLIAAVLILAATRPDTFRVQRAATIKAPPEKIFALISDFQRWGAWSPWTAWSARISRPGWPT
jgi:hypothetical protein